MTSQSLQIPVRREPWPIFARKLATAISTSTPRDHWPKRRPLASRKPVPAQA